MFFRIFLSAILLLILDGIYLYSLQKPFLRQIEHIQHARFQLQIPAVIICYAFILFGLYWFIIREDKSPWEAGFLGLVIYGVYETTTLAIFKDWSWMWALIDIAWGGILFTLTTYFTSILLP